MADLSDINYRGFLTPFAKKLLEQVDKDFNMLNLMKGSGRKGHHEPRTRTDREMAHQAAFIKAFSAIVEMGVENGYLYDDPYEGISTATFEREYHEWVWDETQEEFEERIKDLPPVTFKMVVDPTENYQYKLRPRDEA